MPKVRVHLSIEGRVQGVFFRANTQEEARRRRLTGWVKNLSDGRVEVVCEGEKRDVDSMIEWCRRGPSHAVVTALDVESEGYSGEFSDFTVRF
jgi:acylphosphatase